MFVYRNWTWWGSVGFGVVRFGGVGLGAEWSGEVWNGGVGLGLDGDGSDRRGAARLGTAWQGKAWDMTSETLLTDAWRQLGASALGIAPSRIHGCPDETDCQRLRSDFQAIHRMVKRLLLAYSDYCTMHVKADEEGFTSGLNAFDDAFSEFYGTLDQAGQKLTEELEELVYDR